MTTEPPIAKPPRRFWRRRWRFLLAVCVVGVAIVAGLIGWQMIRVKRAQAELAQVVAELDREEPGWRIDAIEAARAKVPDEENNVPAILRARQALPRFTNHEQDQLKEMLAELSPQVRLTDEQYRYCIDQLERMEGAIGPIQQVARMPRGYCPIVEGPNGVSADLILINKARLLQFWPAHLLVLVDAHDGNATEGLQMCLVNLHIAAAIGDEPYLVCQWDRRRHVGTALEGLERLLGQMEIPELALKQLQAKLTAEAAHDPWLIGLRGERAWKHQAFDATERGIMPISKLRQSFPKAVPPATWEDKAREWLGDQLPVDLAEAHANCLQRHTLLLRKSLNAPWHRRAAAVAEFEKDVMDDSPFPLGFGVDMLFQRLQFSQAQLSSAIAAVATERYRLGHGRWPDSLDDLIPEFLPSIATDAFDGQPLRYKRLADGIVIYTVGANLADDGGNLAREYPPAQGTDIGFRLWDVASRAQTPKTVDAP